MLIKDNQDFRKISWKENKELTKYATDLDHGTTDIQLLISSGEIGHVLLRLVEIIGQDDVEALDSDTLYFMITILNKLDIDTIRNDILLKILPLKV